MKTVILDTDFILNSIKNHIDIETSIKELCPYKLKISIFDKTLKELENKPLENIANKIISKFHIIKTNSNKIVDDLILDYVKTNKNSLIATQDKKLKEKLKKGKIAIITIRQQKHIIFV
ncbi:MAG: hypothetical protein ABIB47_05520 [Candidatus Woesearchaeota archaeon]